MQDSTQQQPPDMKRLAALADLLDNRFRIPGTNIRFGLDAIIGLFPFGGDLISLLISGFLMNMVVRNGAGPGLLLRMMGNYLIDTAVGSIPILGDIFDVAFKANRRNVDLLTQYYKRGEARPSAIKSMRLLVFLFFLLLVLTTMFMIWCASLFFQWLFSL